MKAKNWKSLIPQGVDENHAQNGVVGVKNGVNLRSGIRDKEKVFSLYIDKNHGEDRSRSRFFSELPPKHDPNDPTTDTKSPLLVDDNKQVGSSREIKCLGVECEHATYKDDPESIKLWCNLKNKAVIDMPTCPKDKWKKDDAGYQVSDGHTTDDDFYRPECRGCRDLYYFQDVCDTYPRAWCNEVNCIVDFLNRCPNGKWQKDNKGY